jgi:hypothetical protein
MYYVIQGYIFVPYIMKCDVEGAALSRGYSIRYQNTCSSNKGVFDTLDFYCQTPR